MSFYALLWKTYSLIECVGGLFSCILNWYTSFNIVYWLSLSTTTNKGGFDSHLLQPLSKEDLVHTCTESPTID